MRKQLTTRCRVVFIPDKEAMKKHEAWAKDKIVKDLGLMLAEKLVEVNQNEDMQFTVSNVIIESHLEDHGHCIEFEGICEYSTNRLEQIVNVYESNFGTVQMPPSPSIGIGWGQPVSQTVVNERCRITSRGEHIINGPTSIAVSNGDHVMDALSYASPGATVSSSNIRGVRANTIRCSNSPF